MSDMIIGNRFRLGPLIGQGGMGDVYRGDDLQSNQAVAIKVLKRDIVQQDPAIVERFTREGAALRKLNHANIVKVLASIAEHNQHYLVMEYVGGGSLLELLKRQAQLPVRRVLEMALDLTDALTHTHRLRVIHRDIKPANVLLSEDETLRLTDFGVARIGDLSRITQKGEMIGTYAYLAPEAWNAETIDERTDIWAFGVMLYEMLAGHQPFGGSDLTGLIAAIVSKPPPDIARPDVPPALIALIDRMLEKDRGDRIATARSVGVELEAIYRDLVVQSTGGQQARAVAGPTLPRNPDRPKRPRSSGPLLPNFDLQINSAASGYTVQARAAFGLGDLRAHGFTLPFSIQSLPRVRRQIGDWVKQARITLLAENEELRQAREFGSALFDQIFSGEILAGFNESRRKLPPGERLRLRLRVPDQLSSLPWELLYDSQARQFLMHAPDLSLVRYPELPVPIESLRVDGPLHVVAVLASPASADYMPIKLDQELRRLKAALERPIANGQIALDVIEGAGTLRQLNARLRRPIHVLHILCHGDLDAASGEGVLVFEDADGAVDLVNAELLRVQLEDQRGQIRLALLNACQGALPAGKDPFSSVGAALIRSGVPAVIAMQFALAQEAASQLTEVFYDELTAGRPVDLALTRARMILYGRHPERLDWAIPVLFLRADDGVLFDVPGADSSGRATTLAVAGTDVDLQLPDIYARYEQGLRQLLPRLKRDSPAYTEALGYHQRLLDNIAQARSFGDTGTRKAERATLVNQLNELAFSELKLSFNKLCDLTEPPPEPAPAVQAISQNELRLRWRKALSAFFLEDWEQAETLLAQVATTDAGYEDVQARLAEVRRRLRLAELHRQAGALRDEHQWQAVLRVLDEIERIQPDYAGIAELRTWAEGRRRREEYFEAALVAYRREEWPAAIVALEALLGMVPDDTEAQMLLKRARAYQQTAEQRRRALEQQQPKPQAQVVPPPHADSLLVLMQAGDFAKALDMVEANVRQRPAAREALEWLVRLIEGPTVPWQARLRAARVAEQVGDPRPGVCTLEPAWQSFPADRYAIGTQPDPFNNASFTAQRVRLKAFRMARYPVTVWQFRVFWEDPAGYTSQRWWTPEGWRWKQAQGVTQPSRWGTHGWMAANQPVTGVSWYESAAFCQWLTWRLRNERRLRAGEAIRLPTEAEWEVAAMWDARAGTMRPWRPPAHEQWQNCAEVGLDYPVPVGLFPQAASPGGVFDQAGNVWEWCASHHELYPHDAGRVYDDFADDTIGPALRGGAYHVPNNASGWGARTWYFPNQKRSFQGFRLALVAKGLWG